MRLGLRSRATLIGVLVVTVLLGGGALLLVSTIEHRLTEASDQLSRSRVEDLLDLAEDGDLPTELRGVDDDGVAQVVGSDGSVVAASTNIAGRPPIAHLEATSAPQARTFDAPDDAETETYRVWYATGPSPEGPVTVFLGTSLESVDEATAALRRSLWVGVPLAVLALGGLIWALLGRTLGRLDRIRAEVDRITEDSLDTRVDGDGVDDEVGRLARTMNAMLGRLDAAARRQRDFVADVSHDLQSPLAAQRVSLELALARPEDVDTEVLRAEVLGATTEMEQLVQDLLVLASADEGAAPPATLLDLDDLVLEEAVRARQAGGTAVDTAGVSAAPAYAPAGDVRRIVRNLLENATAHAAARVQVDVGVVGGLATLDVRDDGPGIPPEAHERVFERFHRGDPARERGAGSGLGLSIARSLAVRAGGTVEVVPGPGGAHLRLQLPAGPTGAGAPPPG